MNYQESLAYLDELNVFGISLGLVRIEKLLELMGNPQNDYKTIHVTGTNGKGSVSAMVASTLKAAGISCGLYISPHLESYTELIQIDGHWCSEDEFATALTVVKDLCEFMKGAGDEQPTQFEVITAAAFWLFKKKGVEYAVIEVGLGGLLDSTNVIVPEVSVITNVTFEHGDKCGGTLEGVAKHKAGIIKEGVPVVTGAAGMPLDIIKKTAQEKHSQIYVMNEDFSGEALRPLAQLSIPPALGMTAAGQADRSFTDMQIEALAKLPMTHVAGENRQLVAFHGNGAVLGNMDYRLALLGLHQVGNSALAASAVMVLAENDLRLTQRAIKRGMENVKWPGRFELMEGYAPKLLIDGAHNPAGIETLRKSLDYYFPGEKRIFVFGVLHDKDYREMFKILLKPDDILILTTPESDRAANPLEIIELPEVAQKEAVAEPEEALKRGIELAKELDSEERPAMTICAGSLYLIGALRSMIVKNKRN